MEWWFGEFSVILTWFVHQESIAPESSWSPEDSDNSGSSRTSWWVRLTKLIQHTFAPVLDHKYPFGDIWLWAVFLGWYLWIQVSWVPYPLPRLQWGNENENGLMIFWWGQGELAWYRLWKWNRSNTNIQFTQVNKNGILGDTVFKIHFFSWEPQRAMLVHCPSDKEILGWVIILALQWLTQIEE